MNCKTLYKDFLDVSGRLYSCTDWCKVDGLFMTTNTLSDSSWFTRTAYSKTNSMEAVGKTRANMPRAPLWATAHAPNSGHLMDSGPINHVGAHAM